MFLRTLAILLTCSLISLNSFTLTTAQKTAQKTTHMIAQATVLDESRCSSTAIGPHALLTASHCEQASDFVAIPDIKQLGADLLPFAKPTIAHIDGKIRDEMDHTIYLLSNVTFVDYAGVDLKDKFELGDSYYFFGNPGDMANVFRKGYVAAHQAFEDADGIVFDIPDFHGDSGAGMFNDKGEVACVVSTHMVMGEALDNIRFTAGFPLAFTQAQIDEARSYSPKDQHRLTLGVILELQNSNR